MSIFGAVGPVAAWILRQRENVRSGKTSGGAAQSVDGGDHFGIDFARQHVVHDFHRRFVRDALALDEIGLQPGFFHRARDGLAAAVDDDRVDLDGFEKHDVARDAVADCRGPANP